MIDPTIWHRLCCFVRQQRRRAQLWWLVAVITAILTILTLLLATTTKQTSWIVLTVVSACGTVGISCIAAYYEQKATQIAMWRDEALLWLLTTTKRANAKSQCTDSTGEFGFVDSEPGAVNESPTVQIRPQR